MSDSLKIYFHPFNKKFCHSYSRLVIKFYNFLIVISEHSEHFRSQAFTHVMKLLNRMGWGNIGSPGQFRGWNIKPHFYDEEEDLIDGSVNDKQTRVRKRSPGHVRRCLRLLRTPCCRKFYRSVYIGYRFK